MSLEIYQMTERTLNDMQSGRLERTRQRRQALGTDEPSTTLDAAQLVNPIRSRFANISKPFGWMWSLVRHPAHA
jgi:hypothetical protein